MAYPDEYLPILQLGIASLNDRARALLDVATLDSVDAFIRLMLAARVTHNLHPHRVYLNPLQDIGLPNPADITLTGDYDSLIGFTSTLPFRCPIDVTPIPLFSRTLKTNVHVKVRYTDRAVRRHSIVLPSTSPPTIHARAWTPRNFPTR